MGCAAITSGTDDRYAWPSERICGRSANILPSSLPTYPSFPSVYRQRRTAARGMPVRKLSCAMDILRRCCEKPRITARPRASDVMKLGSPESAWISSAAVGVVEGAAAGLARGATVVDGGDGSAAVGAVAVAGAAAAAADLFTGTWFSLSIRVAVRSRIRVRRAIKRLQ